MGCVACFETNSSTRAGAVHAFPRRADVLKHPVWLNGHTTWLQAHTSLSVSRMVSLITLLEVDFRLFQLTVQQQAAFVTSE